MSLNLVQQTIPFQYELCQPGDGAVYNTFLCTPPRIYREQLQPTGGIFGFYYDVSKDRYILIVQMQYALWPSWRHNVYEIDPETGLAVKETLGASIANIFFVKNYQNGEFKQVYANKFAGANSTSIMTVDPNTYEVNQSNIIVQDTDIGGVLINQPYLLNRVDTILALGSNTHTVRLFDYNLGTLVDTILMSEDVTFDMGYEDNERGWALLSEEVGSGVGAMKINYLNADVESYSSLPSGSFPTIDGGIAYDQKRKMLAVYSQKPNDTDGGHLGTLQIFKPFTVSTTLTAPVPLQTLAPNKVVTMEAHLIDERGLAGQTRTVTVANTGDGTILQKTVTPRSNGTIAFQYQAGANPGSDTITLQVSI